MNVDTERQGEMRSFNVRAKSHADMIEILDFVRAAIDDGRLTTGARLPTERDLAERFGASRNTVRKALVALEADGLIYRHVGRGTFIAGAEPDGQAGAHSAPWRRTSPAQVMEARIAVEQQLGELFAAHATQDDIDRLRHCQRQGEAAATWEEFERWDEAFHEAIAAGTKNPLLIQFYRSVTEVRRQGVWGRIKSQTFTTDHRRRVEREHAAVVAALEDRDHQRARQSLLDHLLSVRQVLLGY